MQSDSLILDRILSSHDIIEYLVARGLNSVPGPKGTSVFCCPLHEENTPSFYVFPADGEKNYYQSFYCYGCKTGGSLLSLRMRMEGLSGKEAVEKMAEGLGIDLSDQMDYLLARILHHKEQPSGYTLDDVVFMGSREIYTHLKAVGFNEAQVEACDRMLQRIDFYAERNDLERVVQLVYAISPILERELIRFQAEKDKHCDEVNNVYASIK